MDVHRLDLIENSEATMLSTAKEGNILKDSESIEEQAVFMIKWGT